MHKWERHQEQTEVASVHSAPTEFVTPRRQIPMKRGADKQIAREDGSDDEIEEISSSQGFKKADDTVLAARPMKGMPKRGMSGSQAVKPVEISSPDNSSKFGGFKGFGATSSSFTYTPPASSDTPKFSGWSGNPAALSSSPSAPSLTGSTPVATTASNATKLFASFLDSSNKTAPAAGQDNSTDEKALDYYKALRGLNVSFMAAVTKAVETDPFVDVVELMERYKTLRLTVQKDYDEQMQKTSGGNFAKSATNAESSKPAPTMPTPPTSFSGFLPTPKPSTSTGPAPTGFVPKVDDTSSMPTSSFFSTPPTSSSGPTLPAVKSPFSLGESATTKAVPVPSPFASSVFGSTSSLTKAPTPFGGKPFGGSPFKSSEKPEGATAQSNGSLFGGSSTSPFNGFGSFTPAATSGAFGAKGSIGNPVGFSFGSPTPEPEAVPPKSSADIPASSTPFGASSEVKDAAELRAASPMSPASRGLTPADGEGAEGSQASQTSQSLLGTNPNDEEGEGEEDEETTYTCRLKVYKMKQRNEKPEWGDHGVGYLRLKKHKTTDTRRMLLRNSGHGKVVINFNLYPGLLPTRNKNTVSFIGHDNGEKATFRLKLKDEASASGLKEALDKEIAVLKAKEDTS